MMRCEACGAWVRDDVTYCTNCGKLIEQKEDDTTGCDELAERGEAEVGGAVSETSGTGCADKASGSPEGVSADADVVESAPSEGELHETQAAADEMMNAEEDSGTDASGEDGSPHSGIVSKDDADSSLDAAEAPEDDQTANTGIVVENDDENASSTDAERAADEADGYVSADQEGDALTTQVDDTEAEESANIDDGSPFRIEVKGSDDIAADSETTAAESEQEDSQAEAAPQNAANDTAPDVAETVQMPVTRDAGTPADDGPQTAATTAPKRPKKRPRSTMIAAVATGAVALAAAVGIFALQGGNPATTAISAVFGSDDAVSVSRTARIIPKAADGTPLEHYFVRIKRVVNDGGSDVALPDATKFEVSGSAGFTLNDIASTLPDGTYYLEIEDDDGAVNELPPINLNAAGTDDPVEVGPDNGGGTSQDNGDDSGSDTPGSDAELLAVRETLLSKLEELLYEHGDPALEGGQAEYATWWTAYVDGVAYAELVDFGGESPYLVVAYLDQGADALLSAIGIGMYHIEVWAYDEASSRVTCVFEGQANGKGEGAAGAAVGVAYIEYAENPDTGEPCLCLRSYDDSIGSEMRSYYGLGDDGAFELQKEIARVFVFVERDDGSESGFTWTIDGETVDEGEFDRALDDWSASRVLLLANDGDDVDDASASHRSQFADDDTVDEDVVSTVNETFELTKGTIDALRASVDDGQDNRSASSNDGDVDAAPEVSAHEVTEIVSVPTFYSGGDESDGTEDREWGYLQLSSDDADVSALNDAFKRAYDEQKRRTFSWTFSGSGQTEGDCAVYRSACTYSVDGVIGTRVQRYVTGWGAHGTLDVTGEIHDVASGEELTAWDLAGVSRSALDDAAVDAVVSYVKEHPSNRNYSDAELRSDVQSIVTDATYLLVDEGITIWLPEYSLGYVYADGPKEIVVHAFDDSSLVGTDVSSKYLIKIW